MLFPDSYREFTIGYTGKFLNHDDTIPESHLQQYAENADQAWKFSIGHKNKVVGNADSAHLIKSNKILKKKFKSIFTKTEDEDMMVDSEKLFQDSYHAGSFQVSPRYESINNNKNKEKERTDKYDATMLAFMIDVRFGENSMYKCSINNLIML
jgi:hypothetical protein